MKRTMILVTVCLLAATAAFPQNGDPAEVERPTSAILFNPANALLGLFGGIVAMDAEFQTALSDHFVLVATPGIGYIPLFNVMLWSIEVGAQFMPMGRGLDGFFITLQPGIGGAGSFVGLTASAVLGYQWLFDTGFVFSLGAGARYTSTTGIRPRIKVAQSCGL